MPFACTLLEQNEGGVFRKQVVLHSPGIGAPPLPMRGIHLGRGLYAESQNSSAFGAKPPLGTYHQTNIGKNNNDNLAQISKFRWKYPFFSLEVFPQGDFFRQKNKQVMCWSSSCWVPFSKLADGFCDSDSGSLSCRPK